MYQNIFISNKTEHEESTVYIWDDERGLLTYPYKDFEYAYKLDSAGDKITIFGDRVTKTRRWHDTTPGIFESDVPRETRVLTDLYLDSDDVAKNHRTLNFDIEVEKVNGEFATVDAANGRITAIAFHEMERDRKTIFLLDDKNRFSPRSQVRGDASVVAYDSEAELLIAFLEKYREYSPTILTGWNICAFDVPYLYHRLKNVFDDDTASMISPIGIVKWNRMRKQYQIAGVSSLDYYIMYQKFTFARRPSYRLHDIGMYEVGVGKVEYEGSLDGLYNTDIDKFIEYNLRDAVIVALIDKKLKMIDLVKNISHVGHTQYEDFGYSSKYIEGTILTYLHRKGIVVPNKRANGREEFEQKLEDDDEGFAGAYVKEPNVGLYEWVYNLDLQSLYPSIIMSLNISPETKVGYVTDWDVEKYVTNKQSSFTLKFGDDETTLSRDRFVSFITDNEFMVSSNGVIYRSDKLGVIPEILDVWFKQRQEFKGLMKQYKKDGNDELADYYDRRQHVQKILLNSIYGVLGLPIFRFYDLDNALAVTATGQDVIKTTAKFVNRVYRNRTDVDIDHCIYIDTDSVYFSAMPLYTGDHDIKSFTVALAREMESQLNTFYNSMAKTLFFCNKNHRFVIKGEAVSSTAFWVAKKRYAMNKVYDLESGIDMTKPKLAVKGLDVVRSSFPPAFKQLMSDTLDAILRKEQKPTLDSMILTFRNSMDVLTFKDVARNTSVKNISEYDDKKAKGFQSFPKGAPAHVKAAITYNRWLRKNGVENVYGEIRDGDKIKWTYLKQNDHGIDTIALKGYDDPQELIDLVDKYIDHDALFENELKKKLEDFYDALQWGMLPTDVNQNVSNFFEF